jgi:FSR family fosmidomycin resistance protein-like MFS transporter
MTLDRYRGKELGASVISNLSVYGSAHALVDAACAAAVSSLLQADQLGIRTFFNLVVLYDTAAFALQSPFGMLIDRWRMPKQFAIIGCLLTAASMIFLHMPYLAIGLAGIGNALFHAGGGVVSLNLIPEKAVIPGLFVAPGAIGICLGMLFGKGGHFITWPLALLLLVAGGLIALIGHPEIGYDTGPGLRSGRAVTYDHAALIIILLLLSIAIRSLVGLALDFPWKLDIPLLLLLTLAVFSGKALGGIVGDRFGWLPTVVTGLVLSAPLLAFGAEYPYVAILGIFLFNLTMPVTLAAIANMLPGRAGLAFGLTTLALIIGAYPTFTVWNSHLNGPWATLAFIIISIAALSLGLKLYAEIFSNRDGARALDLTAGG